MKRTKKSCKILSLVLALCMIAAMLPTISFAAATPINSYTGTEELSTTLGSSTTAVWTKDVNGFAGKKADDKVYTYSATDAGTGQGYMSLTASVNATGDEYDADSQVIEFSILLEDETSEYHFSPAFYNSTGYEYFLANDHLVSTSGKGYFASVNSFIKFCANGIYVTDGSTDKDMVASGFKSKYLGLDENGATTTVAAGDNPLEPGVWHHVAIRTPGLIGGVGEATYDEEGNVVEGVYAGEDKCYVSVDGKEYVIDMAKQLYGTRHIKLHTKNTTHLDNLTVYYTKDFDSVSDYKNNTAMPEALAAANESVAVNGSVITLNDSLTASGLKAALSSNDTIRVYTDNTYSSLVGDSDLVSGGNTVVVAAKNGTDTEYTFNYYTVEEFTYTEDGLCDGINGDISLAAGKKVTNEDGTETQLKPTIEKVDGVFGKDASDKVYKITPAGPSYNVGYNYFNGQTGLNTAVTEFSLAMPESMNFGLQASFYLDSAKTTTATDAYFMDITNGVIKTGTKTTILASASRGVTLGTIAPGEWVNIAIVVPGYNSFDATEEYSNKVIYIYVNGVKNEITLLQDIYGTKHLRFAPQRGDVFYYDNVRKYTSATETYDAKKDAQPVVNFGELNVSGDTILTDEGITVAQLKDAIATNAAVRVFEDSTYAKELEDSDEVPFGAKVVFAATNKRTTERAYSYYTTGEMTYEEPDLYEGTKDLSLGANADGVRPTVNKIDGIYGKASTDTVYEVTVNGGSYSTGYNFLTLDIGKYTLETTVAEFSVLNKNGVTLSLESSFFTSASATDKITVTDETTGESSSVSNTNKSVLLQITDGKVKAGTTSSYFAAGYSGKVLGDAANDEWVNIAIVVPGYNSFDSTEDFSNKTVYIYVNGVKNELVLSKDVYGVRHLRLAPGGSTGDVKTFYYDNIRKYLGNTESYDAKKDAQPVVDFSNADMLDGNINVSDGTTVANFKATLDTKATVRVFADETYKVQLSDTDEMSAGNMVVFATDNKRTTERTYSYYTVNRSLSAQSIKLVNADGKIVRGTQKDIDSMGENGDTYYLSTSITNKAVSSSKTVNAIVASYTEGGKMSYYDAQEITVAPGTTIYDATQNQIEFKNVTVPEGGTLKAFLWVASNNEPLCKEFSAVFNGIEEYHILAIGNSYSNNSFVYLPAIAAQDGVKLYAVNLYEGGCPIETHYAMMKGTTTNTYDKRYEHTPDGVISTSGVTFEEGFNTPGYSWDFITLHQKGQYSPFYHRYYTEEKPYITEFADYIAKNSPSSEFLFFQNWAPYTDRIDQVYSVYESLVSGLEKEEYIPTVFAAIKSCYAQAAEQIGNPNRIIPAGQAIYNSIFKYGFTEYVDNTGSDDTSFSDVAGAMYIDESSHLSTYGKVLSALTWYEYLTGHDVTQNTYQNSKISAEDMALLKQIAHEVCQMEEYNPAN